MKRLLSVCVGLLVLTSSFAQSRVKAEKYPSLLWEITGKGGKLSYLFGTMHVSSKMVFNLSDSFYLAIQKAQVVALETNPGTWQEDFSRYDLDGSGLRANLGRYGGKGSDASPQDFLSINRLKLTSYEKVMEAALYSNPSILNSFLYRSNSESTSDFEEDTYLDLHIFQTGRKLGKKVCGVEDFDGSMQLVKEAYLDAAKDKKKQRRFDYDEDFSYARMEEAYRTGNLDLLDTINKVNSQSAAFDEKFLYRRNEIQAASIDSILRTGTVLFVGVGAAHLPGERGVIELLRAKGYRLRPIRMKERSSQAKENIERIKVPVQFSRQSADDGFYSVMVPGKLYSFGKNRGTIEMKQFADMVNGSYYMVTRIFTNAAIMGQSEREVERKLDSVLYENIPGKIQEKKPIVKNGYRGYDITNRTRRGDVQRYNIFVTPFEIILFKISGNGDYVKLGTEAAQFFNSIQLKEQKAEWKKWSPATGGFEVELPHPPTISRGTDPIYAAYDAISKTAFEVVRADIHNHDFLEEDSFDLDLLEESFASSECIARNLSKLPVVAGGYPGLDATYRYKDSSLARVRFLVQGPHYYTLIATARAETPQLERFIRSFALKPFVYDDAKDEKDTALQFRVQTPVALEKKGKLQMYPEELYDYNSDDADDTLVDNGTFKSRLVEFEPTGEKIAVSLFKASSYFYRGDKQETRDSAAFKRDWIIRRKTVDTLASGLMVYDYELGGHNSSRLLKGKVLTKNGIGYKLETELDTLSGPSAFVTAFFRTFQPLDTLENVDIGTKKSSLFFLQFFSSDTLLHKKAVKNIGVVLFDSTDFPQLKKSIQTLSWKEKKYLLVKKELVGKLSDMRSRPAADFLKELYYAAGDTLELQYAALEALLAQKNDYAYTLFAQLMQNDPPVLDDDLNPQSFSSHSYRKSSWKINNGFSPAVHNGLFLDNLSDSLQLTAKIFPQLLPLITIDDYEQPLMQILGRLVDSSFIRPAAYETYLPKLILEAKQLLKKQLIQEKNKAIAKAVMSEEAKKEAGDDDDKEADFGNGKLSLYATLVLPFWEINQNVTPIFNQLLRSSDRRLKYNALLLLLRNGRPVPDSLLQEFAALDDYRYELYTDLQKMGKLALFPAAQKNSLALVRSQLLSDLDDEKPDTLVFLDRLPLQYKEHEGWLYFFKYKEKKGDNSWKIATAGMVPQDSTRIGFDVSAGETADDLDFTELTATKLTTDTPVKEQLEKLRKKMLYSRRKSASQFYNEEEDSVVAFDGVR